MAIQGSTKETESRDFTKKTGMFEATPVAVNPTREELEDLLGVQLERDIEYTSVDSNGKDKITLSFWLKEKQTGGLFNLKFFLTKQEKESRNKAGNFQYINEIGVCTWATDPSEMKDWFTRRAYRKAVVGEEELHDFMRCWLNLDYGAPDTTLLLDTTKLFKGNVSEIRECIKNFSDTTVCAMATVRVIKDDAGETKEYQSVYNKRFLPGDCIKYFGAAKGAKTNKMVERFMDKATDPEFGCADFYTTGLMTDYNPDTNPVATDSAIIKGTDTEGIY